MNSQREAQKKEDLLLDLYKLNAYIPNDAEDNPLTPFGNFAEGYRVGQADQAKYIDLLELSIKTKDERNAQLQLDNDTLRKALEAESYPELQSVSESLSTTSQPESTIRNNRTTQKPLSEEEIGWIAADSHNYFEFARAIEKCHGIE